MDDQTLLLIIVAAAGLWAAVVASRLLVAWLQLMRMRFGPGGLATVDRSGMPEDLVAMLDPVAARLTDLGFEYEETVLIEPVLRSGSEPVWADVFVHAASGSRATVQAAEAPEPGLAAAVSFITHVADRTLETVNRRRHLLFPTPATHEVEDARAATLSEHWAFHLRRVEDTIAPALDRDAARWRGRELREGLFEFLQQSGFMRRCGEEWCFTAAAAWRYLRQVLAGNRRLASLPPMAEVEDAPIRQLADARAWRLQEALLQNNAMSRRSKVFWFTLSTAAGAAAFGYMTSWAALPILLGVLLFHEFGHALAMRAVGYRGLGVLVIPFLGAVAIGRKDDASPWQKLIVLLAGPLPGLILAVICIRLAIADPSQYQLLAAVGAMALVINLFNLLPFTPLDGGQVVDTFLFCRRPRLRFGFIAISAVALVLIGLALDSTVLAAAGLLLTFALPAAWQRLRLLGSLNREVASSEPVAAVLAHLHAGSGPRWPAFAHRLQTVRALLPLLRGRAPTRLESLGGMSAYLATLALPVALLWDTGLPRQAFAAATRAAAVERAQTPPDWQKQLAGATTPEARWQVLWDAGQWFEGNDDNNQARLRYEEALKEIDRESPGASKELHLLDTRLALARIADPDQSRAAYIALLPALRALPPDQRLRLAEALEALYWLDANGPDRIARLQEAVSIREAADSPEAYELHQDRIALARLLDASGDTPGAEALLRKNLATRTGEASGTWQLEPVAWFFIAHARSAEAEALLSAESRPVPNGGRMTRQALAWAQLTQGKMASARTILSEDLAASEKKKWANWQRLSLTLDLVHASADAPDEEARWTQEATRQVTAMGQDFLGFRYSVRHEAESGDWEKRRGEARLAVLKRLPGIPEEDVYSTKTCS